MKFNRLTKATMVFAAAALVLSGCASGGNGGGDAGTSGGGDSEVKSLGDSAGPYTPTGDEVSTTPDAELHALLPADVTDAGVLNIAVDTLYPPMTFFDDNKRLIGFDAELGRLIGQKLDIPVSLNHQNFDAVIPSLQAGKSDAYVADAVVSEWVAVTTEDGNTFDVVRDPENPAGFSPVYSGIGILKERTELIEAVRSALQALMDEGAYLKALERSNIAPYALDSAQINQGDV